MATEDILTREWRRLAGPLMRVLLPHAEPVRAILMEGASEPAFNAAFADFVGALLQDLVKRRNIAGNAMAHRAEESWEVAISLLGESEILRTALWDDRALFAKGDPGPPFRMIARRALSKMRWPLLARSSGQLRNWDRLDRISRELAAGRGDHLKANFNRCSKEHFEVLLGHLKAEHKDDHNLPRTLDAIEKLFVEFCPDCRHEGDPGGDDADGEVTAAELALLPGRDPRELFLIECVRLLSGLELDAILVHLGDPVGGSIYPSVEIFCRARNIARRQYFKHKEAAQLKLRDCIRRKEENKA